MPVFKKSPFPFPQERQLDQSTVRCMKAAERAVMDCISASGAALPDALPHAGTGVWEELGHELSFAFPVPDDRKEISNRTRLEAQACDRFAFALACSVEARDFNAFDRCLRDMCSWVTRGRAGPRQNGVIGTSSNNGASIIFEDASRVRPRMVDILDFIADWTGRSRLFSGTVAMVAITNIHPYTDGNGRVARCLFNAVMAVDGNTQGFYIPLHDYFNHSRGGALIRQRVAENSGRWDDLLVYMSRILSSWCSHCQTSLNREGGA